MSSIGQHTVAVCEIGNHASAVWLTYTCPGGPVREAVYRDAIDWDWEQWDVSAVVYICQTCKCVVNPKDVQHG